MENLTREYLFNWMANDYLVSASNIYSSQNKNFSLLNNTKKLKSFYSMSFKIFSGLESCINKENTLENQKSIFFEKLRNNILDSANDCTDTYITILDAANAILEEKERNKYKTVSSIYNSLVRKISVAFDKEFNLTIAPNRIVNKLVPLVEFNETNMVFLSYAFDDKLYSYALYCYFKYKGIFLFVDWMWYGENKNIENLKENLHKHLKQSKQFLFLRTVNSELSVTGRNHTIRQWCAWEIGQYYSVNKDEKYLMDVLSEKNKYKRNFLLQDFKDLNNLDNGKMNQ